MAIELDYRNQIGHQMATLTALKLITAKRVVQQSPIKQRRNKLTKHLLLQIELARAAQEGRTFTQSVMQTVTDEEGLRKSREIQKKVRQWWWTQDSGKLALSIRYGSKTIPLTPKANAVEVGSLAELISTLDIIRAAVDAGELDAQIETASKKLREGFTK
jgi:hypothetical protein